MGLIPGGMITVRAESLTEVQAYLPVASCCGRCEDSAQEVIDSYIQSAARPVAA